MVIKMLLQAKKLPRNWLREYRPKFQEVCPSQKQILGIDKKK